MTKLKSILFALAGMGKNLFNMLSYNHTASIGYSAGMTVDIANDVVLVAGKKYKMTFTLYYNIKAYNNTTPAWIQIQLGNVASYYYLLNTVTNSSTTDYITNTIDFSYTFTASSTVNYSSAGYLKNIIQLNFGNKIGTVTLSNLLLVEA